MTKNLRILSLLAALGVLPALAGCGFSPLYGTAGGTEDVEARLVSMEVAPPATRTDQLVRNAFLEGIAPSRTGGGRYLLSLSTEEKQQTSIVSFDRKTPQNRYILNVSYTLSDRTTGKTLTSGKTFAEVSYTKTRQPVADIQALNKARETAARVVAQDIRTRLAAWMASAG